MHKPRSTPKLASLPARRHHDTMQALKHAHEHLIDIIERMKTMGEVVDRLTNSVRALTTAEKSLVALVKKLADEIRNKTDDPALVALADEIDADAADIAAATLENTPADPNA